MDVRADFGFKPYKEDDFGYLDILNPRSSYPSAKRAAETLCIAYKEAFGLETGAARGDSTKLENLGWRALFDIEEGACRTVQVLRAAESV